MKQFIPIIFALFFNSCSTTGKIGDKTILYGECNEGYFACTQFELKEDMTFEYYMFYDVGGGIIKQGKWKYANGDTLVLNT